MMFTRLLSASLLAGISVAGCASDGPPQQQSTVKMSLSKGEGSARQLTADQISEGNRQAAMPMIPAGAQFTIFCASDESANHSRNMQSLKTLLESNMKTMHDWYVVTSDSQSTLYYGFYKAVDAHRDKSEAERARRDKQAIQSLSNNQTQERLFQYCAFMSLDQKDPGGPAEYNLVNAKGYWSLQIGAYQDIPNRKEMAVEAVKQARKAGIEAYYYHGETVSSVCIGAWPEDAIRRQEADHAQANKGEDQTQPLMVIDGNVHLTEQQQRQLNNVRDGEGNQVKVMQPKLEILNKDMLSMMLAYPAHDLNGTHREAPQGDKFGRPLKDAQGKNIMVPLDRSFLVVIPHKDAAAYARQPNTYQPQVPALDETMLSPNGEPQGGKLRSIRGN